MLTREQNELLTQTDRGTPAGELLRRYWQPVALSEELPPNGPPVPLEIMGEELVLFRDEQGRVGLLDRHCCHRGTDLSYGRVECGGLRCLYHGWLYDVTGKCLEQPAAAPGSTYKDKVRQPSYPVHETTGAIFAYMGPGQAPEFPQHEFFNVPEGHYRTYKVLHECNYLQSLESHLDPTHVGFLHRSLKPRVRARRVGGMNGEFDPANFTGRTNHRSDVLDTELGMRELDIWSVGSGKKLLRVSSFAMPNFVNLTGPQGGDGCIGISHVPVNDHTNWRWGFVVRRDATLEGTGFLGTGEDSEGEFTSDYRFERNKRNRYRQDRDAMKTDTFTGIGTMFPAQDAFATESQGVIQDRTKEHLAPEDRVITAYRRLMFQGIEDVKRGQDPRGVIRDSRKNGLGHMVAFEAIIDENADEASYIEEYINGRLQAAE